MNQGLAVILPLLCFAMLDLVIVYNVYKYKSNVTTRTIFLFMSGANFVQQLCGAISYMFDYQLVYAPAAAQYVLYLFLFTAMAVTAYAWFLYLRMLLAGKEKLSGGIKWLFAAPVAVLFCMTAVSPWTHWIVWIGEDGVYRRGTLYLLQFVCTYVYVIFVVADLIRYRKRGTSVYRKRVYHNFSMFILPAVLGSVLQLTVFQGGYTMIGISLAILFLYLDLYVDEVNENQRLQLETQEQTRHLQEVTALNRSLEEAAAEKEKQLEEITHLSRVSAEYLEILSKVNCGIWHILIKDGAAPRMQVSDNRISHFLGAGRRELTEEALYAAWFDRIAPDAVQAVQSAIRKLQEGNSVEITYPWIHPTEGLIYIRSGGMCERHGDGECLFSGYHMIVTNTVREEERKKRELERAKEAAEHRSKELKDQLDITEGLSNAYIVCSCYNQKTKEAIHIKALPEIQELLKDCQTAEEAFDRCISEVVSSEDMAVMKEFTDLSTLAERLKDKNVVSVEFRKLFPKRGWNRASWIVANRDEAGTAYKFLYVVEDVTDSVHERKRQKALIRASNTDALTNLMNRRAYEAELDAESVVSEDLVYIAFDVNGLKYVNDHAGHSAGDELLVGAAECMQKCFGKYGKVFRIGGDEFAAMLHISMEEFEKAGNAFEALVSHWSGKLVSELHIARGFASAVQDRDCGNVQQMSVLADQRMYADKAAYYRQSGTDRRKSDYVREPAETMKKEAE